MALPVWPANHARVLADTEGRGTEPAAERGSIGAEDTLVAQVNRATAPRRTRALRWWHGSSADAAAWIAWAYTAAHRLWTGLPGDSAASRWRIVGGLAGVTLSPANAGEGRIGWFGEANIESAD